MDCLPHIHVVAIHAPSEADYKTLTPVVGMLCLNDALLAGAGVCTYLICTSR